MILKCHYNHIFLYRAWNKDWKLFGHVNTMLWCIPIWTDISSNMYYSIILWLEIVRTSWNSYRSTQKVFRKCQMSNCYFMLWFVLMWLLYVNLTNLVTQCYTIHAYLHITMTTMRMTMITASPATPIVIGNYE